MLSRRSMVALLAGSLLLCCGGLWAWRVANAPPLETAHAAPLNGAPAPSEGLYGKALVETQAELAATPAGRAGKDCESCHASGPDAGATDVALVRSALTGSAKFISNGDLLAGKLVVTATEAVGHRLPSTSTPELRLVMAQTDGEGLTIEGTTQTGAVSRRLVEEDTVELWDTRLLPGESHTLRYDGRLHPEATALIARVEMWPLGGPEVSDAAGRGGSAEAAHFLVWQERVMLPE